MSHTKEARVLEIAACMLASGEPFTMEDLARRAGVSRATLYRRFPNREALANRLRAEGRVVEQTLLPVDPARTRILEVARAAIAQQGPLRVTIEEVATEAGVNATTIYRLFGDKDGLLSAVMEEMGPRREIAALLADDEAPLADTLSRFMATMMRFATQQPGLLRMLLQREGAEAEYIRRLRARQMGTFARLERYLERQRARGRLRAHAPSDMAAALVGMVFTATFLRSSLLHHEPTPKRRPSAGTHEAETTNFEEKARALVDLFLKGAANVDAH